MLHYKLLYTIQIYYTEQMSWGLTFVTTSKPYLLLIWMHLYLEMSPSWPGCPLHALFDFLGNCFEHRLVSLGFIEFFFNQFPKFQVNHHFSHPHHWCTLLLFCCAMNTMTMKCKWVLGKRIWRFSFMLHGHISVICSKGTN